MSKYTAQELEEARFAIRSTIGKCEKSLEKIVGKSPQQTLLIRRIKALKISEELISQALTDLMNEGAQIATS